MKKTLLFILMFALLVNGAYGSINFTEDLFGCYSFDTDITDDYSNRDFTNNGSILNDTVYKLGVGSREFNETKYDYIYNADMSGIQQPFTINAWVKPKTQSGNNPIFSLDKGSLWPYYVQQFGGQYQLARQDNIVTETGDNATTDSFKMLTAVFVNDTLGYLYINGQLAINSTTEKTFSTAWNKLTVGALSTALTTSNFDGFVDELSVWNRSLDINNITELYNSSNGMTCNAIISSGTSIIDSTNPEISIIFPLNTTYSDTSINFNVTANEDLSKCLVSLDNFVTNNTMIYDGGGYFNFTNNSMNEGSYTAKFWCNDTSGNINNTELVSFTINTSFQYSTSNVLYNITFDDYYYNRSDNINTTDYSIFDHVLNESNSYKMIYGDACKWYGCGLFNESTYQYLRSYNNNGNISSDGFGFEFWLYPIQTPDSGNRATGHFWIKGLVNFPWNDLIMSGENNEGWAVYITNQTGETDRRFYAYDSNSQGGMWHHYAFYYNNSDCSWNFYLDGNKVNRTGCLGNVPSIVNNITEVGSSRYYQGNNSIMDEFIFYNSTEGLSDQYFIDSYNSKRLGTPPNLDLYIYNITYELPYNWSDENNSLIIDGVMQLNITFKNQGVNDSNSSHYIINIDNINICEGDLILSKQNETIINCSWEKQYGFHKGYVIIDSNNNNSESNEINNNQTILIPFLDHPWFQFNMTEWQDSYNIINDYEVSKDDYTWSLSGGCSVFNDAYTGENVDPYGKYARTCAFQCFVNNYTGDGCNQAFRHLEGWSNRSITTYNNVQAVHEAGHLGIAYDIMFRNMTQEQAETWASRYQQICQQITNLDNVRPDLDNDDGINGGNGQGFSSGFATLCYTMIGADKNNPTLIQRLEQQYWGSNIPEEYADREESFIRGYKNQSTANYQEGNAYFWYAMYHHLDNSIFHKKYKLFNISKYQNAYNSIALEILLTSLDFNYNGNDLRNDRDQYQRFIQRGDSRSYAHPADGSILNRAVFTIAGLVSNDTNLKKGIVWLRNMSNYVGDADIIDGFADAYLYPMLLSEINEDIVNNVTSILDKDYYDNSNDIFTIRSGYTYQNDTIIQIDGGEERGGGHSQAQGYYLYALGEPFIDYEQVPYQDDVRGETYKNGISLQNDTQTHEGDLSFYNADCGKADINQYYGMLDCDSVTYSQDYPDYRKFPLEYGGDIENYISTKDAEFAGSFVWRPYVNANPVHEYFIKYGDILVKRTNVSNNLQGEGIYHNFIWINNEFDVTINGNTFIENRSRNGINRLLRTDLIYDSSSSLALGGGETNLSICYGKTDCSGSYRGNSNYSRRYYHTTDNNIDFIISHHWYYEGQNKTITAASNGLTQENRTVIFDMDQDNVINEGNYNVSGWGLAYDGIAKEVGAFNTTYINISGFNLFSANDTMQVFIKRDLTQDKIILTANTMKRRVGIDYPTTVRVSINTTELTNDSVINVTKNDEENISIVSQSTGFVTFDLTPGQNSDYYTITGISESGASPSSTTTTTSTTTSSTTTTTSAMTTTQYNDEQAQSDSILSLSNFSTRLGIVATILIAGLIIYILFKSFNNDGIEFDIEEFARLAIIIVIIGVFLMVCMEILASLI